MEYYFSENSDSPCPLIHRAIIAPLAKGLVREYWGEGGGGLSRAERAWAFSF